MTTHNPTRSWLLAPLVLVPLIPVYGVDNDPVSRVRLEEPREDLNRFSVSYAAGWNFKADFSRYSFRKNRGPGPESGGGIDRFYDDGYNRVDSHNNDGGYTSFWGYKNASQLDTDNDRLLMHSTRQTSGKIDDMEDDPQHGFQLTYNRELCRGKDGKWRYGLEAAFGLSFIDIEHSGPTTAGTRTITDAYNLNGVRPPWLGGTGDPDYPEHAGPYDPEGPATIIDDAPTRSITSSARGARITGRRDFDADFYYVHLGPYVEIPLAEKWSAILSGGLSLGIMDGHLHFNEVVTVAAAGTSTRERGTVDDVDLLVGGYLSATLNYALNEKWSVFGGGQYQGMTGYDASGKGRKVELNLTATPFIVAGVSYTF